MDVGNLAFLLGDRLQCSASQVQQLSVAHHTVKSHAMIHMLMPNHAITHQVDGTRGTGAHLAISLIICELLLQGSIK